MAMHQVAASAGFGLPFLALCCLGAALLSALLVTRMIRLAVMDVPGGRSAHDRPVPKGGGVGTVAAVLLGVPAVLLLFHRQERPMATFLLLAAVLLLAVVSWMDDLRQFGVRAKLAAQLAASVLTIGAVLSTLSVMPPPMLLLPGALAALAWLMLVTNATNFIDGLNGLASGSIGLACLFSAGLGWRLGDPLVVAVGTMTAAGLAGFLPFNYPRARIFLGDVGSQVCGLLAGGLALFLFADEWHDAGALAVPLMLAGILWDVLFTLLRRLSAGERLTQAHRGHLYQVAARSGVAPPIVAALHWGFVIWGGLVGVAVASDRPVAAILMVLMPQIVWTILVRRRATRAGLGRWS